MKVLTRFASSKEDDLFSDILLLFALSLILFSSVVFLKQQLFSYPDSMNYASIAREISRGNGFTTKQIRPLSLFFDNNYNNHPTLVRPPLYPLLVAVSQKIFGYVEFASLAVNILAFSAIPPSIYYLGRRFFNRRIAVVSGILVLFNYQLFRYSIGALTEPLYTLIFVLLIIAIFEDRYVSAGMLLGLSYLTHYGTQLLVPGVVLLILVKSDQIKDGIYHTGITGFITVFTTSPWLLRNFMITGDPFFSLQRYEVAMFTQTYPGRTLYRLFEPISISGFILSNPTEMAIKIIQGSQGLYLGIPSLFQNWIMIPLAAIGLYNSRFDGKRTLLIGLSGMIGVQFIMLAAISALPRLFIRFSPIIILFSAAGLISVVEKFDSKIEQNLFKTFKISQQRLILFVVVVVILPSTFGVALLNPNSEYVADEQEAFDDIKTDTPKDAVIISNTPWTISWYSDRVAIWMPAEKETLNEELSDVDYIYISPRGSMENQEDRFDLIGSQIIEEEFEVEQQYESGAVLLRRE